MKTVKNLSVANIKGTKFIRREDLDFSDDGNRFRGFAYDNGKEQLPITTLYSDGEVYCDVRPDYIQYFGVPFEMWKETEEYRLCGKYNGTSELIDLEDLANICERVLAKLNELACELYNMNTSEQEEKIHAVLCKEQAELKDIINKVESFNWFNLYMNDRLSDYDMKNVKSYFNGLKREFAQIEKLLFMLENGTMSKKDIIHYADFASRGHVIVTCRFYIEQITEFMNR